MKNVVRLCLLFALLLATMSAAYSQGPPDIITNGDFNSGLTAWRNIQGTTTVGGGSCGANTLYLETAGTGLPAQAHIRQCINLVTPPAGTWTYAVGLGTVTNSPLSLNANYRFSNQPNCIGGDTGGPFSTITTFPGEIAGIVHPVDAQSVQIDIILTEGIDGAATACVDDISFVDSGGVATVVSLSQQQVTNRAPAAGMLLLSVAIGLAAVTLLAWQRRTTAVPLE